ncbi:hypothetical protein [Dysgonomonas sp. 520]|uniref:hypothetical protein n=1 Tax=Dysgonomonas sp. 520 TaxID=2302931 RepID=UPI0013D22B0F|nr:hypothetical protein [Dysgonomonas sp. 520]NDW08792.1 hypothetical protein [Dysgonomonas sp. 520]
MNVDDITDLLSSANSVVTPQSDRSENRNSGKLAKFLAKLFSIVLNPFLMPVYGVLLLSAYTNFFYIYKGFVWQIVGIIAIFTLVLPSLFVFVLKSFGVVKDINLTDKKDRFLPYGLSCFSNMSMVYYFYDSNFHSWFIGMLSAPILVLILGAIINAFWKISAHMLGIGAVTGITMAISYLVFKSNPFPLFMLMFILAGCLGTSRLYLVQRSSAQVHVGFVIGFVASYFVVWLSIQNIMYI